MKIRDRKALRRSIAKAAVWELEHAFFPKDDRVQLDVWEDDEHAWQGPEVIADSKELLAVVKKAALEWARGAIPR